VCLVCALGFYAAYRADGVGERLLAITIVGLLSCTVPPLAWGHHWVWIVPLLAVVLNRAARSSRPLRWAWIAATAAIYLAVFMWFTVWVYREARGLAGDHETFSAALGAAVDEMTKADRLLVVAIHPGLFVVVACATIVLARRPGRKPAGDAPG
jgi:alpha-1,2-mannosyltransferase